MVLTQAPTTTSVLVSPRLLADAVEAIVTRVAPDRRPTLIVGDRDTLVVLDDEGAAPVATLDELIAVLQGR